MSFDKSDILNSTADKFTSAVANAMDVAAVECVRWNHKLSYGDAQNILLNVLDAYYGRHQEASQ